MDDHKDVNTDEWTLNRYVIDNPEFTRLRSGFWYTDLKLPITLDLCTCYSSHRIYALFKYRHIFESLEWLSSLERPLPELSDGILHTGSSAHYHYLIDGLGNLSSDVLKEAQQIFIDDDYSNDQLAFLEAIVHSRTRKVFKFVRIPRGTYRVSNVIVPKSKPYSIKVRSLRELTGRLRINGRHNAGRIYVTRQKAASRHLINEADIIEKIKREYQFIVVENEEHNLFEQVRLYANAEFVIGPHGAGLSNIVFSGRPRGILEFWHSVKQPFFESISKSLEIFYVAVRGRPMPSNTLDWRKDNAPFIVDEKLAFRAIELLVSRS